MRMKLGLSCVLKHPSFGFALKNIYLESTIQFSILTENKLLANSPQKLFAFLYHSMSDIDGHGVGVHSGGITK